MISPGSTKGCKSAIVAFTIYGLEKHITGVLHPTWTPKLGSLPLARGNQEAEDVADFIDIILFSSCVPPVLPGDGYRGQRVLDGGIIDNVPTHLADGRDGRPLVLLSKRYLSPLPAPGTRIYLEPSELILSPGTPVWPALRGYRGGL